MRLCARLCAAVRPLLRVEIVRIHHIEMRDAGGVRVEVRVDQLQDLRFVGQIVGDRVYISRLARQDEHLQIVLDIHFQRLFGKPENFTVCEIRLHIAQNDFRQVRRLRQGCRRGQLFRQSLEEELLCLDTAQVALRIAAAVAHEPDRLLPAQRLRTFLEVNVQILVGVIVVHIARHIDGDSADGIDDLLKGLNVDHDIVVHIEAHKIGNFFFQILDVALAALGADAVGSVDFFHGALHIGHRIPRNAQNIGALIVAVQRQHQNGVGVEPHFVRANHQHVVDPLRARLRRFRFLLAVHRGRLDKHRGKNSSAYEQHGQQHQNHDQNGAPGFFTAVLGRFLRLFLVRFLFVRFLVCFRPARAGRRVLCSQCKRSFVLILDEQEIPLPEICRAGFPRQPPARANSSAQGTLQG